MINGYGGSILRVDLTSKSIKREPVTSELAHDWLGGRAWIAKYMYDELPAGVDPLSPANKVFIATGPLSGTLWPSSAKILWGTKSPLTGGYIDSNMGGMIMAELKYAGVDMIILEGRRRSRSISWLTMRRSKYAMHLLIGAWVRSTRNMQ